MWRRGRIRREAEATVPRTIDRFVPEHDVRERMETVVRAPADLVLAVARGFDAQSIPLVHAIFWLRERVLGGTRRARRPRGIVEETLALGWGMLAEQPGRELVIGAYTRPWEADVVFTALPPERFAAFRDPGFVKIAWTLEVEPLGPALTRLATETRAVATDDAARGRFRRYWRRFGVGAVLIRRLLLAQTRREAERRAAAVATTRGR